ncbi:MAG TPA: hypothetical protein VKF61_06490 [Candidatus Polarisedimenticolia bacterium]|nr:hypothetical protein [Candidatus Polarisedimenticolia bacterium]
MGYPINPEILQSIVQKGFYDGVAAAENERLFPRICMDQTQKELTELDVSFGSVPEPTQFSGKSAAKLREYKELKDYKLTCTLVEWEDSVDMPRIVLQSNPEQGARIASNLGQKVSVFYDKRLLQQMANNPNSYDAQAWFSTTHNESGSNQINTASTNIAATATPFTPTGTELETSLTAMLAGLKNLTDDQGTPVNEGVSTFTAIIPPDFEWIFKTVLDPKMAGQAVDASGVTGRFRGIVNYVVSAYCTSTGSVGGTVDRFYVVANNTMFKPATLRRLEDQQQWDIKTNIGAASAADPWNHGLAMFTGYCPFEIFPWDWKTIFRQVYT